MNRRKFFKNLGIIGASAIIAPKIVVELLKDSEENKFPHNNQIVKDFYPVEKSDYQELVIGEFDAIIENKTDFTFEKEHNLRVNDIILVSNGRLESIYIVTESLPYKLKAVCTKPNFMLWGEVKVCHTVRKFYLGSDLNKKV